MAKSEDEKMVKVLEELVTQVQALRADVKMLKMNFLQVNTLKASGACRV